jgi:hypothetical protein
MSEYIQEITFEQAKKLAEERFVKRIGLFRDSCQIPILSEQYVEAECCWFFFRNKQIQIPESQSLLDGAYVVSKKGNLFGIADFSNNPTKLKEYLEKFFEHLKECNE